MNGIRCGMIWEGIHIVCYISDSGIIGGEYE